MPQPVHGVATTAPQTVRPLLPEHRAHRRCGWLLAILILLSGCGQDGQTLESGSAWPRLAAAPDGSAIVSYLLRLPTGAHGLRYRRLQADGWGKPTTIASNEGWLDNWADSPRVVPLTASTWVAAWFVFTNREAFAYDIRLSLSTDAGTTWGAPFSPHHDGFKASTASSASRTRRAHPSPRGWMAAPVTPTARRSQVRCSSALGDSTRI